MHDGGGSRRRAERPQPRARMHDDGSSVQAAGCTEVQAEAAALWAEIAERRYTFAAGAAHAAAVRALALKDLRRMYAEHVAPAAPRRAAVYVQVAVSSDGDSGGGGDAAAAGVAEGPRTRCGAPRSRGRRGSADLAVARSSSRASSTPMHTDSFPAALVDIAVGSLHAPFSDTPAPTALSPTSAARSTVEPIVHLDTWKAGLDLFPRPVGKLPALEPRT
jgi:hypothetical protein